MTLSVTVVDGALRVRRSDGDLQLADLRNESDDRLTRAGACRAVGAWQRSGTVVLVELPRCRIRLCADDDNNLVFADDPHRPSICRGLCASVD